MMKRLQPHKRKIRKRLMSNQVMRRMKLQKLIKELQVEKSI
jgi:membrane protein insertase Oxa1/YidC/SpoIIIJ